MHACLRVCVCVCVCMPSYSGAASEAIKKKTVPYTKMLREVNMYMVPLYKLFNVFIFTLKIFCCISVASWTVQYAPCACKGLISVTGLIRVQCVRQSEKQVSALQPFPSLYLFTPFLFNIIQIHSPASFSPLWNIMSQTGVMWLLNVRK